MKTVIVWHDGAEQELALEEFHARMQESRIPGGALVRASEEAAFTTPADFIAQFPPPSPPSPPAHPMTQKQHMEWAMTAVMIGVVIAPICLVSGNAILAVTCAMPAALMIYFAPSIVALERKHHQRNAIIATNLLLGWTFLGWAAALIWALTVVRKDLQS